jgi:hypothetical protein
MKLNISFEADQDVSLWALVKLFLKVSIALMPAILIWMIVPLLITLWMSMLQQLFRHA